MEKNDYFKLLLQEKFINQVIDKHPASIVLLSSDGKIKFVNENFLKLTGYLLCEIYDKNYFDIFVLKEEKVNDYFKKLISKTAENPHSHINYIISKDGRKILMLWTNFFIEDEKRVVGTISFGYDITFREEYIDDIKKISKSVGKLGSDYTTNMKMLVELAKEVSKADAVVYNRLDVVKEKVINVFSTGLIKFEKEVNLYDSYCYKAIISGDDEIQIKYPNDSLLKNYGINLFYSKVINAFDFNFSLCFLFKNPEEYIKKDRISIISKLFVVEEVRRIAFEKINREKDKFLLIIENMPFAIVYASRKTGNIYHTNQRFLDISGRKKDESIDLNVVKDMVFDKKEFEHFIENPSAYHSEITLEGVGENGIKRYWKFIISNIGLDDIIIIVDDVSDEISQKKKISDFTTKLNLYSLIDTIFIKYRPPELYQCLVDLIKDRVGAEYAFIGFIDREKDTFKFYAMSQHVNKFCKIGDVFEHKKFVNRGSLWAKTLEDGKVYFINEKKDVKGHLPIKNAVSIPVKYIDETIGVIMMANREGGWDEESIKWLEEMSNYISQRIYYLINNEKLINEMIDFKSRDFALSTTSSMIAGIAHDLNNMLVPVLTNISLIKEKIKDPQYTEMLYDAEKYLLSAANLIKGFLNLSNASMIEISSVSLNDFKNTLKMIANGFSVDVIFKISQRVKDIEFETDLLKLYQIMTNLIKNAAESMQKKVDKKIEIEFKLSDDEKFIEILIRDFGCGIPDNIKDDIFKPYFTTKKDGKGLGLFMTYMIIKAIGGEIDFVSNKDKGTTFFLKIPFRPTYRRSSVEIKENRSLNIVVVDDEEFILKSISKILKYLGHNVYAVSDSNQIEDIIRNNNIDIAIVDLILGDDEGIDVNKKIKEIKPSIFSVVSTGYTDNDAVINLNKYGFDYYLPKPYTLELVKKMIEVYFSKK